MAIFSENKILNRIVTHLNANGFTAHNKFGEETNLDKALQQVGNIYCFFEGADYEVESNEAMYGTITLQFWVVDQAMAAAADKSDYTADLFRAYVASGSWKDFGIPTDYPNEHFEVFFLESERTSIDPDTFNKITIFRGSINFQAKLS